MISFSRTTLPLLPAVMMLVGTPLSAQPERHPSGIARFHDPATPILEGKTWHVFSTGQGIISRYSTDLKDWKDAPPVFKEGEFPAWQREVVPKQKGHLWAPDIIHRGGRYLLYYSVSGWGKNVSAIGLVTNPTLDPASPDYKWKDEGIIIRSNDKEPYNAIDPQLFADTDGSLWMVFGSFWTGIQLIELDPKTGHRHGKHKKVHQLAWHESIEAPALLKHGKYYYLFVNWGLCCRGTNSTYEIRVGRSKKITGPYLDAEGRELSTGGGTVFLGT
ncbi:MAG: arabinan endo-1,5-alpha-L-arabinosidase, partial [Verrucomicrobiaceae bacterium]